MVLAGSGTFVYEMSSQQWGDLPADWSFREATSVAVNSEDEVYVFNRGTHPMVIFDSGGNILRYWGEGIFTNPHGVTIGPDGEVYCVDAGDHTVRKFTSDGKLLMTLGEKNQSAPPMSGDPFNLPTHMAIDQRNGDLYVSDGYGNARVHKYSPDGRHLLSWGESGTAEGQFNVVHYLATDKEGWVYVADRENRRIQIFDSNGNFETQWVNMSRAACIYIDHRREQLVYVGEFHCGIGPNSMGHNLGPRVSIIDTHGNILARLSERTFGDAPGQFYSPHGIAVDSKGDIYVAEVSWNDYGRSMNPPKQLRSMQKLILKDSTLEHNKNLTLNISTKT